MAIPNYQEFMNPVLKIYADLGAPARTRDIETAAADALRISADDRLIPVKSEANSVVHSRVHWAAYYLYVAGLLAKPQRGFYQITDEGKKALKSGDKINDAYLMRYAPFADFLERTYSKYKAKNSKQSAECGIEQEEAPDEQVRNAIANYNEIQKEKILDMLRNMDSTRFEFLVKDFMERMNYGEGTVTQRSNDGGIDVIINEDELGLSKIYLQAKRWKKGNNIGRPDVQGFSGAMDSYATSKGVFITTSDFIKSAVEYVDKIRSSGKTIIMINGDQLAELMIKNNIGVKTRKGEYEVKEVDTSFFED